MPSQRHLERELSGADPPAVCRHVGEETQQEIPLHAGVKGRGDDDVTTFLQVLPKEHATGVDVDGAAHLLLGDVHAILPV